MRPPISQVSPQLQFLATIATIKPGCAHRSGASAIASKAAAHARSHLPSQPNPHSPRTSPAGSFLGGFRTPAAGGCLTVFAGRHPKPCTKPAIPQVIVSHVPPTIHIAPRDNSREHPGGLGTGHSTAPVRRLLAPPSLPSGF